MGAIDLDSSSNSHEIPNMPAAKHYTDQDNGDDCAVEVGHRDCYKEDADGFFMPCAIYFCDDPVCWVGWCFRTGGDVFTGAILCLGWSGAVLAGVCGDCGSMGCAKEMNRQ